jgi:FkbM family methyltransferase
MTLDFRARLLDKLGWPRSFALFDLDRRVSKHLNGRRNGFFIEAGANDGIKQSNTLYFERYLGWRGLLIEPIPELARACMTNRPNAIVEHAALVPFDHPDSIVMRSCGLMSVVRNGMRSPAEENEHVRLGAEIQNIKAYDVTVPAKPLQAILDRHAIVKADLFFLDVEGFEAQVLAGIDHDRFTASCLVIEARYKDEVERSLGHRYRALEQLTDNDYIFEPNR